MLNFFVYINLGQFYIKDTQVQMNIFFTLDQTLSGIKYLCHFLHAKLKYEPTKDFMTRGDKIKILNFVYGTRNHDQCKAIQ